ncbi:MAG: nitrous oxide reductase family maturation protein NosD [Promethearchaeota archaeon]
MSKKNRRVEVLLGTLLIIIISLSLEMSMLSITNFNSIENNRFFHDENELRNSLISGKIHINNNWSDAKDAGICSGYGTYSDPYIIEDLIIDCGGEGSGIFIENSTTDYFIIRNCTIYNSGDGLTHGQIFNAGIRLLHTSNGTIIDNYCFNNAGGGIYLDNSNAILVQNNTLYNNDEPGIYLEQSYNNLIISNNISFSYTALQLDESNDNQIVRNNVSNGHCGISIYGSFNNVSMNLAENNYWGVIAGSYNNISSNTIINNEYEAISCGYNNRIYKNLIIGSQIGFYLENRQNVIYNNSMYNCGFSVYGSIETISSNVIETSNLVNNRPVYFYSNKNGLLAENFTHYGQPGQIILYNCSHSHIKNINISNTSIGMIIHYCFNTTIEESNLFNNTMNGIDMRYCENQTISNNNFKFNMYNGLNILRSHNTTLTENEFKNNNRGVLMGFCNRSIILNNTFAYHFPVDEDMYNGGDGINIYESFFNLIAGNNVYNNTKSGIILRAGYDYKSNYNVIIGNNISYNGGNGLYIEGNYNNISGNIIIYNNIGIDIESNSLSNYIFSNIFISNNLNARDDGVNNHWDYLQIGNYWDDYTGFDIDDDGIGEDPYNISGYAGSQDHYPFATEASQAPKIIIHSPLQNEVFPIKAPKFNVTCLDIHLNETWYSINGGANHTFSQNGTINQLEWETHIDGPITIRFYANDSLGHFNFKDLIVIKDTQEPLIDIYYPDMYDCFNNNPPYIFVLALDDHIDSSWYSVNGGKNITFNIVTRINQSEWVPHLDGIINITFYSNDTVGNVAFKEIQVIKDTIMPTIEISSPLEDQTFGSNPPNFTVTIKDEYLDLMWYTIDDGVSNHTFTNNGTINRVAWDALPNGIVTIRFYAQDKARNIVFEEIDIVKNVPRPEPEIIFGYNPLIIFCTIAFFCVLLIKRIKKKKNCS